MRYYLRQERKQGSGPDGGPSITDTCCDAVSHLLCCCCATVQEAEYVEIYEKHFVS